MIFRGFQLTQKQKDDAFNRGRTALARTGYNFDTHEETLCKQNPLYHIIFHPFREYKTARGETVAYIDRVLGRTIDIVMDHVGQSVCEDQLVVHALRYIRDPTVRDKRIKTLALFFFMWQLADVVDFFRSLYPHDAPSLKYFNEIVYTIIDAAKQILYTGFTCYNINDIIDEFYTTLLIIFSGVPLC